MTIETATYISDLVAANPADSDQKSEGAAQIRLLKATIKATLPNVAGAVTPTHTELNFVDGVTSAIQTQIDTKSPTASPTFTGVPAAPTAAAATNTTQLATTAHVFAERTNAAPLTNKTLTAPVVNSPTGIVKGDVGLGSVDDTSDAAKPVSTATQTALDLKAPLASPTFTGTVVLPSTTSIATVSATEITYLDGVTSALQTQLDAKAALASPALTGAPTAPTATAGTATTQIATTAFVGVAAFSAALPAQTGNAGKFVATDGATASWADAFTGTAKGTVELLTGAAIASAATINLDTATGNRVHVTGTTTITAVTLTKGPRTVIFDGILTLTHHATNNNLPGAANITTAAGDRAIYESDGTTVYCVSYIKVSGAAVVASSAITLLSTVTASTSATVDVETTLDGTYDAYLIVAAGLTFSDNGTELHARLKIGGSYIDTTTYLYHNQTSSSAAATYSGAASAAIAQLLLLPNIGNGADRCADVELWIHKPTSAFIKKAHWTGSATNSSGAPQMGFGAGCNSGTGACTGVRFKAQTGTIVAGSFRLYGFSNS